MFLGSLKIRDPTRILHFPVVRPIPSRTKAKQSSNTTRRLRWDRKTLAVTAKTLTAAIGC